MEVVSAASIIASAGTGTWLADKLLGPSFDALGEQFRAFAGKRLTEIFGRAEQVVDWSKAEALPPGFALQFVQKASFSEDDPIITDLWAGLLADAAEGISNRHSIFIDILSQIGPKEAISLELLFNANVDYPLVKKLPMDIRPILFDSVKKSGDWWDLNNITGAETFVDNLMSFKFGWPAIVRSAEGYWTDNTQIDDVQSQKTKLVKRNRPFDDQFVVDALCRQKLIEFFEIDFKPGWAAPTMDGYFMTVLGVRFVQSCRYLGMAS